MSQAGARRAVASRLNTEAENKARNRKQLPPITSEARRYALKELARRAGVLSNFFEKWTVEVTDDRTIVSLGSETGKKIEFSYQNRLDAENTVQGLVPIAKAGWLTEPTNGFEKNLIIPFCHLDSGDGAPLFSLRREDTVVCAVDLLASIVLTLARVEEELSEKLDSHGRFPATESAAWRHEFLERPILDEIGVAFAQALTALLPGWRPADRRLRVKLTHDIDEIGMPFRVSAALGHSVRRRRPAATARDFASLFSSVEPTELALVRELASISNGRGFHSAFYWKAGESGPYDAGYDVADKKVQRVVDALRDSEFELGVHPGYETFRDRQKLASEVEYLRQSLNIRAAGGRQHYLRWTPETWLDWEASGLAYDSSLGFADAFGFRAGTAIPYRPWSFEQNREINLLEIPLILMDCTPVKYMKLERVEALERIQRVIERIARTGGVFTLLWHNSPLMDPAYDGWYEAILDLIAGAHSFGAVKNADETW